MKLGGLSLDLPLATRRRGVVATAPVAWLRLEDGLEALRLEDRDIDLALETIR